MSHTGRQCRQLPSSLDDCTWVTRRLLLKAPRVNLSSHLFTNTNLGEGSAEMGTLWMSALERTAINNRGVQCNAYRSGISSTSYIDRPSMNIHNHLSFIPAWSWELRWKTRPSSRKTSAEVAPSSSVTSERTTSVSWFRLIATVSGHHGDCLWILLSTSHLPFLISAWSNAWLTDCPPIWIRRITSLEF